MFGGERAKEKRREAMRLANVAADNALIALAEGDPKRALKELAVVPRRLNYADGGWKPALTLAVADLALGKYRAGISRLAEVCKGLDETDLSRDEKGYLRLYALYRAIEVAKDGKAPVELRDLVEDFSFDQTYVSQTLKAQFPLKKLDTPQPAPPPMALPPDGTDLS